MEPGNKVPGQPMSALRLPVRAEAFQGLADVDGMLLFDGASLRFEFRTTDALFGVLRSDPKQVMVPLANIEAVRRGRGWFWLNPYIEIELNDFALLSQVPGSQDGRWRLRVRLRDRQSLHRFAAALAFARSGDLHERLNVGLDTGSATRTSHAMPAPPAVPESQRPPQRQTED